MEKKGFEHLRVFLLAEELADAIWELVVSWDAFAKRTVGAQLVCAADSIGANIAEGHGRYSYKENKRFVRIARGSLNETRFFLRRAFQRKLMTDDQINRLKPMIQDLGPMLNAYLRTIGTRNTTDQQKPTSG